LLGRLASGLIMLTILPTLRKKLANKINSLVHYAKGTLKQEALTVTSIKFQNLLNF